MAKKKAKTTKKTVSKKSHGELFDKHTNLIWLLPIFFIVAVIAVLAIKNMNESYMMEDNVMYQDEMMNEDDGMMEDEMMTEDGELMYEDTMMDESSQ